MRYQTTNAFVPMGETRTADGDADDGVDPYTRVRLYWSLGRLRALEGQSAEALEYIRNAIALLKATDDTLTLARAYLLAAGVELRDKSIASARRHLELAEALLGTAPERLDLGMLRIGQSRLAGLEGNGAAAVEHARDALALLGDFHGDAQGAAVHRAGERGRTGNRAVDAHDHAPGLWMVAGDALYEEQVHGVSRVRS